jgi:hypothetical protein
MVKGLAVQNKTSWFNTFYRLLPMINNSNQQHRKMVIIGAVGEGALSSRCPLRRVSSFSDRPNIYTMSRCQMLSCRSPCVNGLFPLVQYRSWLSGLGQMLSNEDEAILDSIISLYLCPSSINLYINKLSLSIGWSSRTNLHGKYISSVFM